jgi:hypothetical protein
VKLIGGLGFGGASVETIPKLPCVVNGHLNVLQGKLFCLAAACLTLAQLSLLDFLLGFPDLPQRALRLGLPQIQIAAEKGEPLKDPLKSNLAFFLFFRVGSFEGVWSGLVW